MLPAPVARRLRYLENIHTAAKGLLDMINDLLEMAKINLRRFDRQQVNRNCIAGKSIQSEDIKLLAWFVLERQPRIAQRDFHFRFAVGEIGEV